MFFIAHLGKLINKACHRDKANAQAFLTSCQPQTDRKMRFANTEWAKRDDILTPDNELSPRQF